MVAWREASMEIEGRSTDTSFENKREGALRDTSVIVVTLDLDEVFIIARLYTRTDTHVIHINPTTRAS
ncbi:hypothetical protein D0Y65_010744 [Glycine soja]|uniref:Uncharacterized protein n=1 Tax=Glycine soja TaxID=3848 RepID=A0A445L502_GLYSO|nr:hypothetical protein D0Y65_010744 [Glycine soja]